MYVKLLIALTGLLLAGHSVSAAPPTAWSEMESHGVRRAVDFKVTTKGALQLHLFEPRERADRKLPVIVFFHGGGSTTDPFFPQSTYLTGRGTLLPS